MSSIYNIINTFNNLVSKQDATAKKTLTEATDSKPKTKLEETMAKVESDFKTFKDGDKKEPMKKAAKAKKPDYSKSLHNMFGGSAEELTKNLTVKKKTSESAENPHQQRILDANKADLAEFLKTGYLDTTSDLYYQMYEYYANQMDPKTRRDQDAQYDFITNKIREVAGGVSESAAPGQEDWIRANKSRFIKQYGKDKGMEVLYATAWGRSKNESAYDSEVSAEDPVFEANDEAGDEYGWDVKAPKEKKASTRQVAGKAYGGAAQKDDEEESSIKPAGEKRGRGRPAGTGKKTGAKITKSGSKNVKEASDYGWDYPEEKSAPSSRKVAGTRYGGAAQKDDDEETSAPATGEKRGRGRPAGSGKKMGAKGPSGKSKLMSKGAVKEGTDEGADMVKLAKVIASCTTPEQLKVAQKMASNFLRKHRASGDDFRVSAFKNDMDREQAVKRDIGAKARSFTNESRPSLMDRLLDETYANFGEAESDLTLDQDQLRQHIGDENFEQLQRAIQVTGTYPEEMYDELFDYFSETGEIPLGAAHARDEDPYQWIHQKLEQMFGDEVGYDQENIDIDMGEPDEDYGTYGDDERPEEDEMNAESVNESKDMIAESLSRILHSYPYEVKTFLAGGDMDNDLYQALVDYYHAEGELPRQVMAGSDTMDWIADKFGTDLRNVELEEGGPKMSDVPAYLRKAQGQNFPLSRDQITPAEQHLWVVPGPGSRDFEARAFPNTPQGKMAADEFAYGVKGNVVLSAEQPVTETGGDSLGAELNELARLAGLKESIGECGEMSPFTQSGQPEQTSGMSINTNIDTRTGTKTMTVTADGEVADQLAKILSLSGLGSQVTARSSEVVGQDVEQEPEMQVVAVGEAAEEDREQFHASTTPDPKVAGVDAIVDQGDDLNRKKKQHADKPKLGDNPLATENFDMGRSLMRELESIKIKK